jgi:opacity protein-like surface antigen
MNKQPVWCIRGLAALVLLCAAGGTSAADLGFYVVLDGASTSMDASLQDFTEVVAIIGDRSTVLGSAKDTKSKGYNVTVGYQLGSYFAVEGSYVQAGKFTYDFLLPGEGPGGADAVGRWRIKPVGPTVSAVGLLPLGPYFSLDGHLGFFFVESKHKITVDFGSGAGPEGESLSDARTAPFYGAGFSWWITGQVALRLGFNEYHKAIKYRGFFEESLLKRSATQYTLGLRYSYGY